MNHYERLGVERDVTLVELRRAYRELAQLHHPDRNQDDAEVATRRMAAINEAFEVLSDPVRKFDYNRSLDRGVSQRPTEHGSPDSPTRRTQRSQPTQRQPDDPIRQARREAKEREAAEAKARGYRDPGGGFFGRMNFRKPR